MRRTSQGLTKRQGFQGHVINDANAVLGATQTITPVFCRGQAVSRDEGRMLCSHCSQHNRASMPEWDQEAPQPSLLLHWQVTVPWEQASKGLSTKRPETLSRSKSNQTFPHR